MAKGYGPVVQQANDFLYYRFQGLLTKKRLPVRGVFEELRNKRFLLKVSCNARVFVQPLFIRKINESAYIEGRGEPYFTWTVVVLDVNGFDLPFAIDDNSVLALDICDTWYAFTKKQWENHKNDEI